MDGRNIAWTPTAGFAGLSFHHSASISTSGYDALTLALKPTSGSPAMTVQVMDPNGTMLTTQTVYATSYGPALSTSDYGVYYIPLRDLGAFNTSIKTIHIRNWSGSAQPTIYVDRVGLASLTPIYDEGLSSTWSDWSWDSTNNMNNTAHPFLGSKSIAWTANAGWAGLSLHASSAINLAGYRYLTFALRGNGSPIGVQMYDPDGNALSSTIPTYSTTNGSYQVYLIPLSALGVDVSTPMPGALGYRVKNAVQTIHLRNWSSAPQPVVYVDHVGFL